VGFGVCLNPDLHDYWIDGFLGIHLCDSAQLPAPLLVIANPMTWPLRDGMG
jgi:hypothetical protein